MQSGVFGHNRFTLTRGIMSTLGRILKLYDCRHKIIQTASYT